MLKRAKTTNEIEKSIGKYFYITSLIVFVVLMSFFFYFEIQSRNDDFDELKVKESRIIAIQNDELTRDLADSLSDLKYLHNSYSNNLCNGRNFSEVALNWAEFGKQRNLYDQIRFIDEDGNEKIRINKDEDGTYVVSEDNLQNKADRDYFKKTIDLPDGDFYISSLDLNIEDGKIEIPQKPVIRLSTPLYSESGDLEGIIIINYLASSVLNSFKMKAAGNTDEMSLLNSDGYYFSTTNSNDEWGFMYDDTPTNNFATKFPIEWKDIARGKSEIYSDNGIFFSTRINLEYVFIGGSDSSRVHIEKKYWFIVLHLDPEISELYYSKNIGTKMVHILEENLFGLLIIMIVSLLVGFVVYFNIRYYSRIKYFSQYDSLTGVYSRGYGMNLVDKVAKNKKEYPLSFCFIDINGLKEVNDNLGHKEGSLLIELVAVAAKFATDSDDIVIRLGGDEFLIVFKNKRQDEAEEIWKQILNEYDRINKDENLDFIISVSHGILEMLNVDDASVNGIINLVDKKMYEEKIKIKRSLTSVIK
ncbi:MAG: sensor domain-containing diguanylate cyclase [Sphaerochaetaceae bacterium]|nr:sensor domain-containing diguanylate cyclase [Sphaerochaetaceae bacterium]